MKMLCRGHKEDKNKTHYMESAWQWWHKEEATWVHENDRNNTSAGHTEARGGHE